MTRSSDAVASACRSSRAAYQRSRRAPGDGEAFALNSSRTLANSARDSASARPSAAGSSSVTSSRPSCQCAGVSRPRPGRRRRCRRPAAACAANGSRPSSPRQPQSGGERALVRRRQLSASPSSRPARREQREQALEVRQRQVGSTCWQASERSEANGTSRCMRRLSEQPRGAKRARCGRVASPPHELALRTADRLALHASRPGRARNRFISFISGVSMLGIALGVAALIIVLSVMNGFQKEVRDRMLSVISHVEVIDAQRRRARRLAPTASEARRNPQVIGAAPFVASQALIARGDDMRGIDRARHRRRTKRRPSPTSPPSSRTPRSRASFPAPGASSSAASWRARSAFATATRSP